MRVIAIKTLSRISLAGALSIGAFATANATLIVPNGSFSGSLNSGSVTTTFGGGANFKIGTTTSQIVVSGGTRTVSGVADPYLGAPNNLSTLHGGPVAIGDPLTIPVSTYNIVSGPITPFTVSMDSLALTLTSEIVTVDADGAIGLAFVGTVTGAPAGFSTGEAADFSIGFTEAGADASIGVAYSIDTPILPTLAAEVPEPGTLAVLGMGLMGLVGMRRKPRLG